jgi:hypothetical protein
VENPTGKWHVVAESAGAFRERGRDKVVRSCGFTRIAVAVVSGLLLIWLAYAAPIPFISSWWQSSASGDADMLHRRHRIADWLVLRGLLLGKSRPEVIALLGEPPLADKFRGDGMVYVLGPERSLISIDYEWLILRFGKNETVESAWVATD